jgi:hypothetical protein
MYVLATVLIAILIIFMIMTNNNKIIEGYDARYADTSFNKCAEFCKTTSNCGSFGYDKTKNICYPSQLSISGKPMESLFKDEYLYSNATCNKIQVITEANPMPPFDKRRSNSVYTCTETYDKQPQYYFHNNNDFKNIGEGRNIDDIFDVDNYPVRPFKWPRNRFDYDQKDLLIKTIENNTYNKSNITDLNRIVNYTPQIKKREKKILPPRINHKPVLDFNLQRASDNIYNYVEELANNIIRPLQIDERPRAIHNITVKLPESIDSTKYKLYTDFNNGEYMTNSKCTKDIPLNDCIKSCSNNSICKGVEWNPTYNQDKDVCCLYRTIGQFSKRNDNTENGSFFKKL